MMGYNLKTTKIGFLMKRLNVFYDKQLPHHFVPLFLQTLSNVKNTIIKEKMICHAFTIIYSIFVLSVISFVKM